MSNLTPELKAEALATLDEIRRMIERERMPPPTPVRNRCADCDIEISAETFFEKLGNATE